MSKSYHRRLARVFGPGTRIYVVSRRTSKSVTVTFSFLYLFLLDSKCVPAIRAVKVGGYLA